MDEILKQIVNQPLILAPLQKIVVDLIRKQLKGLDSVHFDANMDKYTHIALLVLSTLTTFLKMFIDHQTSQFDPTALVQYAFTLYASTLAVHEASSTILPKKK